MLTNSNMPVLEKNILYTNIPEKEYCQTISLEHRKQFAQFFTPYPIAKFMANWILGNSNCKNVLDPAFGLGVFSRALFEINPSIKMKGFDIDERVFEKANGLLSGQNVSLYNQDYLYNDWNNKYDGIICNPPYLKFHDYNNKSALQEIKQRLNFSLTGFSNLYTLFLLKSIYQLNKGGRAAYIVPSEFMNSDYGKNVKSYLIENSSLRYIIVFDFEENIFDDALTTSCILLFANDNKASFVEFIVIKSPDKLIKLNEKLVQYPTPIGKQIEFSELKPEIKWRSYYQNQNSIKYKNIVPLSTYGKVVRGIATGANNYFTFNIEKQKQYNIRNDYLLPCITKSNDVSDSFFTKQHVEELKQKGKNIFLLNAKDTKDKYVAQYIHFGEKNDIHKKHLTSHRNPWYILENRPPSPIWVSVFNRKGLRFIRNEAGISNLTTFHCLYLNMFSVDRADLLFAYLLTDVSKQIFNDNRREYGNGLEKFEPNDLNHSKVVDLDKIDPIEEKEIVTKLKKYRDGVLKNEEDKSFLGKLNDLFLTVLTK